MRILNFTFSLFVCSFLLSCSSVLYHPTSIDYVRRDTLKPQPQELWIPVEDDLKLHAWHFEPTQNKLNRIIIQFHGNAENLSSHFRSLFWTVEEGYDFVVFDYRSYGKSPGKPSPQNTAADGAKVILELQRLFPDHQLIVYGQSIGGAIALTSLIQLQEKSLKPADLIVIEGSFDSYQRAAKRALAKSFITWLLQPLAFVLMSDKYAPHEKLDRLSPQPLLFIHGQKDPIISPKFSEELFAQASDPKEIWWIPNGRHIDTFFIDSNNRSIFLEKIENYLKK